MGGPAVKPKALGDIIRLSDLLPDRIELIGSGGATYGRDVLDFLRVDASIVQFTSAFWAADMDHKVPGNILSEFVDLPETEGFLAAA